jgi:hypothetical protein
MRLTWIDHIQIGHARGTEDEARAFYEDILGIGRSAEDHRHIALQGPGEVVLMAPSKGTILSF